MEILERPDTAFICRRTFLKAGIAVLPVLTARGACAQAPAAKRPTRFQIACMTLPYAQFPMARALTGIRSAGYTYVAWGTTHKEEAGKDVPVIAPDAPPARARSSRRVAATWG